MASSTQTKAQIRHMVSNVRLSEALLANEGFRLGRHVARSYPAGSVTRCESILAALVPAGPYSGVPCSAHGAGTCHRRLECHVETTEAARYLDHPSTTAGVRRGVESVRAERAC